MNHVLVLGSGGREHAMAWRLRQSSTVTRVQVAPGNGGTALEAGVENVSLDLSDFDALIAHCRDEAIDLVIVGPEQPLVDGVVDALDAAGIACFGPNAAAARLEGSKAYTKAFLQRHDIPTADYAEFSDLHAALQHVNQCAYPTVIKADGLAAGKGVVIAADRREAESAVRDMLSEHKFGAAGSTVVIEEFLHGEEASFMVIADGEDFLPLATSQDHKARDDGDRGPNTGGMGAYSPAPIVDQALHQRVIEQVIKPTLHGLVKDGTPFRGFLYAGLMIDAQGQPRVLEFNVRMGDPETQPILQRLRSNLDELCLAALNGQLKDCAIEWDPRFSLGVVLAQQGYPGHCESGQLIAGLASLDADDVKVFHAGTRLDADGRVLTHGGRVLCVCALHANLKEAKTRAYHAAEAIHWDGKFQRNDIGDKAINRACG